MFCRSLSRLLLKESCLISIQVEDYVLTTLDEAKSYPMNECRGERPFAPNDPYLNSFSTYRVYTGFGMTDSPELEA
jgi:hypothetical protein